MPRASARIAVFALVLLLTFVALPEALGDHPFDPRPTRVLPDIDMHI
jgi:hypothetical protein